MGLWGFPAFEESSRNSLWAKETWNPTELPLGLYAVDCQLFFLMGAGYVLPVFCGKPVYVFHRQACRATNSHLLPEP